MKQPAFPIPVVRPGGDLDGLTKREYAAIHIAAAIETRLSVYATVETSMIAARAVALADAVLKEAGQ
jgi:hypothetical protein